MDKLEGNSLAIVKLCGSNSPAAAVVVDHAVLSWTPSSSTELLASLIKAGCKFTLRHLYFFSRVARKFPQDLERSLSTLGATPLAGLEEDAALLSCVATQHMDDTKLVTLQKHVDKTIAESSKRTITLVFDHDDVGRVCCTRKPSVKSDLEDESERDGLKVFWQPSPKGEVDAGLGGSVTSDAIPSESTGGVNDFLNASLSSKDLAALPKRGGGDLEVTVCVQDVMSLKTRRGLPRQRHR
ncbi:hypothetical protein BCV69DRAFT_149314 [Microstroma glucosiphilum]|uniref:Uncharacterized protein n=1 Tax=Pseudomicrostroma glucosiphilum TaxID=1684307 RepID=A0A316UBM9_9BASI|nr:hypothetical protein BCV69DRAFT_149314 [Pseudomicrostroma glucosiphilum]PWN22569.1 hypothetical protein BCV69DRAFT_149314 [Pseudomicrostroma glucosiphilum]